MFNDSHFTDSRRPFAHPVRSGLPQAMAGGLADLRSAASWSRCFSGWKRDGHMLMVDMQRQRLSHLYTRDPDLRIEHD